MPDIRKVQNNFTSGVLSESADARNDIEKYAGGCKQIVNCIVKVHGGVSNRPGTYHVDEVSEPGRFIEFTYNVEQTYALLFMDEKMRIYKDGGVVVYPSGPNIGLPVEIVTPYAYADLAELTFAQSADVIFFAHSSYLAYSLTRTDHHLWTFAPTPFAPVIAAPTNPSVNEIGFTGGNPDTVEYKISAVSETSEESYPSASVTATTALPWTSGAYVDVTWDTVTDAVRYNIYKNSRGYWGWIGSTEDSGGATETFKDDYIQEDSADGPKEARNPFDSPDNYPGAVGIFQQRLVYGKTNNNPQTIWTSQTGLLNNFSVSYPLKATDAIEGVADTLQMNEIRHFFPLQDLLVFTSGAEILMSAGRNSDGITPTGNLHFTPQSYWGTSYVPPIIAGDNLIAVQNSGSLVRAYK